MIAKHPNELQRNSSRYALAIRYFVIGQIGFLIFFTICIILIPRSLAENSGFTYYGVQPLTTIPFRLAFVASGLFTLLSSLLLPNTMPFKVIKYAFWLMIVLLIGVVLTTSYANWQIRITHVRFGQSLFILQGVLGIWLSLFVCRDRLNLTFMTLLIFGGLASLLSLYDIIGKFIEAQISYQLAFAALILYSLIKLKSRVPGDVAVSLEEKPGVKPSHINAAGDHMDTDEPST